MSAKTCPHCEGYGYLLGAAPDRGNPECNWCNGTGRIQAKQDKPPSEPAPSPCPLCRGSGEIYRRRTTRPPVPEPSGPSLEACPCPRCAGSGAWQPLKPEADQPLIVELKSLDVPAKPRVIEIPKPGQ